MTCAIGCDCHEKDSTQILLTLLTTQSGSPVTAVAIMDRNPSAYDQKFLAFKVSLTGVCKRLFEQFMAVKSLTLFLKIPKFCGHGVSLSGICCFTVENNRSIYY